jgi:DNA polymerase (family 10)
VQQQMSKGPTIPYDEVEPLINDFEDKYTFLLNYSRRITGSFRRGKAYSNDVDVLYVVPLFKQEYVRIQMKEIWGIQKTQDKPRMSGMFEGFGLDIHMCAPDMVGAMLMHTTGPWQFNRSIRTRAKVRGMKLNQYGLWEGERLVASKNEDMIFNHLGLTYLEPEDRYHVPRV